MKIFNKTLNGKEIKLIIKEAVSYYSCVIDIEVNGKKIAENATAEICQLSTASGLYLGFMSNESKYTYLCICNKEDEHNGIIKGNDEREITINSREIADYIWENIQENKINAPVFEFTTKHWRECEEYIKNDF